PPYGTQRLVVSPTGEQRRIGRNEKFPTPPGWTATLVPSDDQSEVEVVRFVFETYTRKSIGLRGVANELNRKGIPSPNGGIWSASQIRDMLSNPCYKGEYHYGRTHTGKFNWFTANGAVPSGTGS